ncbi:uncharacterized protein YxjI [Chitinophaga skermanii]|uniref:Uncharacterized protein YxjI n=1 Tax=Chitinophaga skermanii TaxID=331697 RepID=A0A327QTQ6_9BACT|nr:phospholipid scramblase-related protein [Chitinophaga skermanii]RAJ05127.1 uncharacterized protein YxjI [Chitinophaga skermanii]
MQQKTLSPFFLSDDFFIDEKVGFLKFHNAYKVFNPNGEQIGNIVQHVPTWHKFLRILFSKKVMPFTLNITDMNDQQLASIERGWTFWLSKITIKDQYGTPVGGIKHKFSFLKPKFVIHDQFQMDIAHIKGDWKAWEFSITDQHERALGRISKKWAGAMKEIFTTADKYHVSIASEFPENENKIALVAGAITIDMVLKESK